MKPHSIEATLYSSTYAFLVLRDTYKGSLPS